MEIRLDFYTKEELAIRIDYQGRYPFPASETSDLFAFACFALRQLSNLANHPVANVLATLLAHLDTRDLHRLARGTFHFPNSDALANKMQSHGLPIALDFAALQRVILPGLPSIVQPRGDAKKAFVIVLPPFRLYPKGFGILGVGVNYYALQSVVGLARYLAREHSSEESYLAHLATVANFCGAVKIDGPVPLDQPALATAILNRAGVPS